MVYISLLNDNFGLQTLVYLTASFIVVAPCAFAVDELLVDVFLSSFLAALAADLSPASRAEAA